MPRECFDQMKVHQQLLLRTLIGAVESVFDKSFPRVAAPAGLTRSAVEELFSIAHDLRSVEVAHPGKADEVKTKLRAFALRRGIDIRSDAWELVAATHALVEHAELMTKEKSPKGRKPKYGTPVGDAELHSFCISVDRLRAYLEWKLGHTVHDAELARHIAARMRKVPLEDADVGTAEFNSQWLTIANKLSKWQPKYDQLLRRWGTEGAPSRLTEISEHNFERRPGKTHYAWAPTETEMESWPEWKPRFLKLRNERKAKALASPDLS